MTKKILLYILTFLLLLTAVLFLIPVKQRSFTEYYAKDDSIKESLLQFRSHPTKSISYNHNEWHYLSVGQGPKSLLFLHGMGGAYDIWFQQIAELQDSFHIISLTLPSVNSLSEAANGILQILQEENIDRVSIIGTSMGGYIAQYFLKEHGERLDKVVLGNTFPPNEVFTKQNGGMRKLVPLLPAWIVMSTFRNNVSTNVLPSSENSKLVEAYLSEQYSGLMTKQQFIGRFDIVLEHFEIDNNEGNNRAPMLIIESDNDPLVNKDLRKRLKDLYAPTEIYTFTEKGHFPYLNRPQEYTDILLSFLSDSSTQNN